MLAKNPPQSAQSAQSTQNGPIAEPFDAREDAIWRNVRRRLATQGGSGVAIAVTTSATSKAVTFARSEFDTKYGVSIVPSWSTSAYVAAADKSKTGFTVHFGTAAPAGGTFDYLVFRAG